MHIKTYPWVIHFYLMIRYKYFVISCLPDKFLKNKPKKKTNRKFCRIWFGWINKWTDLTAHHLKCCCNNSANHLTWYIYIYFLSSYFRSHTIFTRHKPIIKMQNAADLRCNPFTSWIDLWVNKWTANFNRQLDSWILMKYFQPSIIKLEKC